MSATLAPEVVSDRNPMSEDVVKSTLATLGLETTPENVGDFNNLLTGIWEVWDTVDQLEDYVPEVDEARFPRNNVYRPEGEENKTNGWAWKCEVKDTSSQSSNGLLAGKTVTLKDNIALKGVPCLLGTNYFTDWVPNTDATVAKRVLEAGATVTGKAVCENFSAWGVSCSAATGPINNVFAEGFSAGGSSSGSGVLVGTGECWGSMGGDQGGSIRIPSASAGIVGLKPTTGLVPYTGIASLQATMDTTGPMTKTVLDNALLLQAVAGADGIDDRSQAGCPFPGQVPDYPALAKEGVKGMKVGILIEGFDQPLRDDRISDLVRKAAKAFESLGCVVEEVSVPMHKMAPNLWAYPGRISKYTEFMGHVGSRRGHVMNDLLDKIHPIDQASFDKMWPSYSNTIVNGKWAVDNMPPSQMGKGINLIRKLKDEYNKALGKYDVLITPTMVMLAPKLPPKDATIKELMANSVGVSLNTSAFNITGLPALSLPVGFLPSKLEPHPDLPVGMQIISKYYQEPEIYRLALAWEQAFDWKTFASS